jgi:hypothetical protein
VRKAEANATATGWSGPPGVAPASSNRSFVPLLTYPPLTPPAAPQPARLVEQRAAMAQAALPSLWAPQAAAPGGLGPALHQLREVQRALERLQAQAAMARWGRVGSRLAAPAAPQLHWEAPGQHAKPLRRWLGARKRYAHLL